MNTKLNTKLSAIALNWINGNKMDASIAIRKLTKVEIATLLIELHQLCEGYFIGRPDPIYDFERFTLLSLERYY